jgi:hypothetical protein
MQRALVFRLTVFEVIPLFVAAGIAAAYPHFAPAAFIIVALLVSINTLLSIRVGATLARGGHVIERRRERFLFWFGISVHLLIIASCLFFAVRGLLGPNHAMQRTSGSLTI